jgi:hypothetical protein
MTTRRPIATTPSARRAGRNSTTSVGPGVRIRPAQRQTFWHQQDLTEEDDPRNPGDRGTRRPSIRTGDHTRRNTWRAI